MADIPESPLDHPEVHLIKGDPTRNEVLERAGIYTAEAAIVLGGEGNQKMAETQAILTALAVESLKPKIYTCVILYDHENKRHLEHADVDEAICVSEVIFRLLAQSSINHGLSALIAELLIFKEGCEIYKVKVPPSLQGLDFVESSYRLLKEHGAILLAVEAEEEDSCGKPKKSIAVNPRGHNVLKKSDRLFVVAESLPQGFESAG